MSFTGGNLYIAIFMALMFIGVVYGYHTTRGSGIAETPYGKIYGDAPGAGGAQASASGHDESIVVRNWTRGTR